MQNIKCIIKDYSEVLIKRVRPKTLFVTVFGLSLAYVHSSNLKQNMKKAAIPFIIQQLCLQSIANIFNDIADQSTGVDDNHIDKNKKRISEKEVRMSWKIIGVIFFIASLCNIYISTFDLQNLIVFFGGIYASLNYSKSNTFLPTFGFGYKGFGEALALIIYGPLQTLAIELFLDLKKRSIYVTYANGITACLLMLLNNYRDTTSDKSAGKITLPLILGDKYTKILISLLLISLIIVLNNAYTLFYSRLVWIIISAPVPLFFSSIIYKLKKENISSWMPIIFLTHLCIIIGASLANNIEAKYV